jgi:hypothetical protein
VATVVNDHNRYHTYISRQRYVTTLLNYKWMAIPLQKVSAVRYRQSLHYTNWLAATGNDEMV